MKLRDIPWDGSQITKPGMYSRMPLNSYHHPEICDGPSISSTGLRSIYGEDTSPRHFYDTWAGNPNRTVPKNEPRHFIVGRALHHLVLGQPFFAKLFVQQPESWPDEYGEDKKWNNNRMICRRWNRDMIAAGRTPLTTGEVKMIGEMAKSIGNHPMVDGLTGLIERSYFWKDKETGIWLKWRPDATPTHDLDFVDLKSTLSAAWGMVSLAISKYGYYRQAALGREACRHVLDADMGSFTLLFVEKKPPWDTIDVRCKEDDLQLGMRENRAAVRLFAKCLRDNKWPGHGHGKEFNAEIGMSAATMERRTERLKYEGLPDGQD